MSLSESGNRKKMVQFSKALANITLVTQFGLSLITPTLLCLAGCWLLVKHTGIGAWIYIFGFIFGLGSSFMVAYKLYLTEMKKTEKEKEKRNTISFNKHV